MCSSRFLKKNYRKLPKKKKVKQNKNTWSGLRGRKWVSSKTKPDMWMVNGWWGVIATVNFHRRSTGIREATQEKWWEEEQVGLKTPGQESKLVFEKMKNRTWVDKKPEPGHWGTRHCVLSLGSAKMLQYGNTHSRQSDWVEQKIDMIQSAVITTWTMDLDSLKTESEWPLGSYC